MLLIRFSGKAGKRKILGIQPKCFCFKNMQVQSFRKCKNDLSEKCRFQLQPHRFVFLDVVFANT
jgi:hypothetical protein